MNKRVNKFLLAGDKFMYIMDLRCLWTIYKKRKKNTKS